MNDEEDWAESARISSGDGEGKRLPHDNRIGASGFVQAELPCAVWHISALTSRGEGALCLGLGHHHQEPRHHGGHHQHS